VVASDHVGGLTIRPLTTYVLSGLSVPHFTPASLNSRDPPSAGSEVLRTGKPVYSSDLQSDHRSQNETYSRKGHKEFQLERRSEHILHPPFQFRDPLVQNPNLFL